MSNKENFTFGLKNFRNYDADGAEFIMAPITILTGENSAGKSSLVKALMLMNKCMERVKEESNINKKIINFFSFMLDFTDPQNKLGRYDIALNRNAEKNSPITFSYSTLISGFNEEVTVEYSFAPNPKDILNNGCLKRVKATNHQGEVLYDIDFESLTATSSSLLLLESFRKFIFYTAKYYLSIDRAERLKEILVFNNDKIPMKVSDRAKEIMDSVSVPLTNDEVVSLRLTNMKRIFPAKQGLPIFENIRCFINHGILTYLPIFDKMANMTKEQSVQYLSSIIQQNSEKWLDEQLLSTEMYECMISQFDIVAKDFMDSSYNSFLDYYANLEKGALCDRVVKESPEIFALHSQLFIFNLSGFSFDKTRFPDSKTKSNVVTFKEVYNILMFINENSDQEYYIPITDERGYFCTHPLIPVLQEFGKEVFYQSIIPGESLRYSYVSSSRARVQRLYSLESSMDEFSSILIKYFEKAKLADYDCYQALDFSNKWLRKFGVGHHLSIVNSAEGLGVMIKIHDSEDDIVGHLLADEGYGITQLISILLQIETSILSLGTPGCPHNMEPFSEPVFGGVIDLDYKEESQTIAIEEPEIHLHPKYQSLLADMFLDAYQTYNIRFIIETHSEYLIRESQVLVSKMGFQSNKESDENSPFRTYYIPKDGKPYSLGYRKDGRFAEKFGDGFYNESTILTNKML